MIKSVLPFLVFIFLFSCTMNKISSEEQTLTLKEATADTPLIIHLETGAAWSRRMQAGPLIFNVLPQFVIWTEDTEGRFLETLYITGADGKMRHAKKNDMGEDFYRTALPTWADRAENAGLQLPGKKNIWPDTVTSATPTYTSTILTAMEQVSEGWIYLEINQTGDDNQYFNEETNGWPGQPSLIYRSAIPVSGDSEMELIAHGALFGGSATLYEDLTCITTAKQMLRKATVTR